MAGLNLRFLVGSEFRMKNETGFLNGIKNINIAK